MENVIPIVFVSDENYILATSVAIESLIKTKKKNSVYKIFVIGINISLSNKNLIESQNCNNVSVKVIDVQDKYQHIENTHPYITNAMFFKFDVSNILSEYDKVLFLDSDVVVCDDLCEMFNFDITDNYAGVIKDLICCYKSQHKKLNLENYFNTGVLLINALKIREENLYPRLCETLKLDNYEYPDQDVLNIVFNQNVKFLDIKYNFLSLYCKKEYWDKIIKYEPDLNKACKNPSIIHYVAEKPWNFKRGIKFNVWRKFFKTSPYRKEKFPWQKDKKLFEFKKEPDRITIRIFGIGLHIKV